MLALLMMILKTLWLFIPNLWNIGKVKLSEASGQLDDPATLPNG
jgi:hypothetical protein